MYFCFMLSEKITNPYLLFPGTEAAVNPTVGIHLQTLNPELYPVPCFSNFGPPPPYEEILKSSRF